MFVSAINNINKKLKWAVCLTLFVTGGLVHSAYGQTSYPMLMALEPVALQVGQTAEYTVESRYTMFEAYQVLVSGEGVTGVVVSEMKRDKNGKAPSMTKLKVKFTATADAMLGVRDFRIATPNGISTVGQLVLTPHPVIVEAQNNNTSDKAQSVPIPAALCGSIEKREDVDFFKFKITDPGEWNFHVRGMRLQDKIHDLQQHADPILTLRTAEGAVLAVSDNYYFADPFLVHHFDQPGEYLLEMRDVRYQGNRYWRYCLEVNPTPYATTAHPVAIAKGSSAELKLLGPSVPSTTKASFTLDDQSPMGAQPVSIPLSENSTHPVELLVTESAPIVENLDEKHGTLETALPVSLPTVISGTISEPGELDLYKFEAKKGESFTFEVKARRLHSTLDSIIRIMNSEGKSLKEADDLTLFRRTYSDSLLESWKAPAEGTYYLEIRDLHLRGGDTFTYAIEATRAEPHFFLELDTDKTIVTPGTSSVMFIRAYKKNGFNGEIKLEINNLPAGVTASCGTIPAGNQKDGCIILTASPDAAMSVHPIEVRGVGQHAPQEGEPVSYSTQAVPMQETYRPGGGRAHWPVGSHIVSVGKPGDIRSLKLSTNQISLKPGEKVKIDITLERAEGFDKNILLDPVFSHLGGVFGNTLPSGVKMNKKESKILLTGKEVKGHVVLEADPKAKPAQPQQVAMMANISLNFVMKRTYCAEPLWVTIAN